MWTDRLTTPPPVELPTYRLIRLRDQDNGYVLSHRPVYLPSHWMHGRSYPCTKPICDECPWCRGQARREHAYLGLYKLNATTVGYAAVLELPPTTLHAAIAEYGNDDLFGAHLRSTRSHKRATPRIELRDISCLHDFTKRTIDTEAILRTLAKVYGLPMPDAYDTHEAWSLAVQLRTNDPSYSPARSQPPAN